MHIRTTVFFFLERALPFSTLDKSICHIGEYLKKRKCWLDRFETDQTPQAVVLHVSGCSLFAQAGCPNIWYDDYNKILLEEKICFVQLYSEKEHRYENWTKKKILKTKKV